MKHEFDLQIPIFDKTKDLTEILYDNCVVQIAKWNNLQIQKYYIIMLLKCFTVL